MSHATPGIGTYDTAGFLGQPYASPNGRDACFAWPNDYVSGTYFQIYVDRKLAWHGTASSTTLGVPTTPFWFDIIAVNAADATKDFSSYLPVAPKGYVTVSWEGPASGAGSIVEYRIYSSAVPSGPVVYTSPVDSVRVNVAGTDPSGTVYTWRSGPLALGAWTFAVVAVDAAGNEAISPPTVAVITSTPPTPPSRDANGNRLTYAYNSSTRVVTLNWTP